MARQTKKVEITVINPNDWESKFYKYDYKVTLDLGLELFVNAANEQDALDEVIDYCEQHAPGFVRTYWELNEDDLEDFEPEYYCGGNHSLYLTSDNVHITTVNRDRYLPLKRIVSTYATYTQESIEAGDSADAGFLDEEGVSMMPDDVDLEDNVSAVQKAIEYLDQHGAFMTSNSHFAPGTWYSTSTSMDMHSGEYTEESYFLHGFSQEEQEEIFNAVIKN